MMKEIVPALLLFLIAICGCSNQQNNCGDHHCGDGEICIDGECFISCNCQGWEVCDSSGGCDLLPGRCNRDFDCDSDQRCLEHLCVARFGSCRTDGDCGGELPYCNQYRRCVECKIDLHCELWEQCGDESCILREENCNEDGDCPVEHSCHSSHICLFDCERCGENSGCNPEGDRCVCDEGYYPGESGCVDFDECAIEVNPCGENTRCINRKGGYECLCNEGFHREGAQCVLNTKYIPCFNRAPEHKIVIVEDVLIWWRDGAWEPPRDCHWRCEEGFHIEDQIYCLPDIEVVPCRDLSPENGEAIIEYVTVEWMRDQPGEGYWSEAAICRWQCRPGYREVDDFCVDIDECSEGISECPKDSSCRNTGGGFSCDCVVNYHKEGEACVFNYKEVPCDDVAPEHATSTIEEVVIEWGRYGWGMPEICPWVCDDGYAFIDGGCHKPCTGLSIDQFYSDGYSPGELEVVVDHYLINLSVYDTTPEGAYNLGSPGVNDNYETCNQCVVGYTYGEGESFFQRAGVLVVERGDLNTLWSKGALSRVVLEEVVIDEQTYHSTPVTDGVCLEIEFAPWDTREICEGEGTQCRGDRVEICDDGRWEVVEICGEQEKCSDGNCVGYDPDRCTGFSIESLSRVVNEYTGDGYLSGVAGDYTIDFEFYGLTPGGNYNLASTGINDNYATCDQCVHGVDRENGRHFFQRSGTLIIYSGDPATGSSSGEVRDLILEEVAIDPVSDSSTPVAAGECLEIETIGWDF